MALSKRQRAAARRLRIEAIREAGGKHPNGSYKIDETEAAEVDAECRARQARGDDRG